MKGIIGSRSMKYENNLIIDDSCSASEYLEQNTNASERSIEGEYEGEREEVTE